MLTTSNQDTRQNGMRLRAWFGAVTTVGLAGDHSRTQPPFGEVIGGVQLLDVKEAQQMRAMFSQTPGEAGIVDILQSALRSDQGIQARLQVLSILEEGERIQAGLLPLQRQRLLQKGRHLAGKLQGSSPLALFHFFQILEQVAQTFLFQPGPQSPIIISQETIRSQNAFEFLTQNIDHDITRAVGADRVDGGQRFRPWSHLDACGSRGLRSLLRMLRPDPLVTGTTITTEGHEAGGCHLHLRNVRDILLMGVDLAQLATTDWTALKFGGLGLIHLLETRLRSMRKIPSSRFASGLLRMLHPFPSRERRCLTLPRPFQLIHFYPQKLHYLLQLLNGCQSLPQLLLQFRDPLVFRAGLAGLVPLVAHHRKSTAFDPSLPESFGLSFSSV